MNKYGWLSLMMVGFSMVLSIFFINDQNQYRGISLLVFAAFSITGVIFAFRSKKRSNIILGSILNMITLVCFFILLLATGIGEA